MFLHRIKIVTLAGFTIWIDASWLILAALLTSTLALGSSPGPHALRRALASFSALHLFCSEDGNL
jgi:hypothetical protein